MLLDHSKTGKLVARQSVARQRGQRRRTIPEVCASSLARSSNTAKTRLPIASRVVVSIPLSSSPSSLAAAAAESCQCSSAISEAKLSCCCYFCRLRGCYYFCCCSCPLFPPDAGADTNSTPPSSSLGRSERSGVSPIRKERWRERPEREFISIPPTTRLNFTGIARLELPRLPPSSPPL